jgi:hypothetical protein
VRKLRELWLALRVERAHTKDEILTAYLNTIYLGQRGPVAVIGIEAATRHYFGHSARDALAHGVGAARRHDPRPGLLLALDASRHARSSAAIRCSR